MKEQRGEVDAFAETLDAADENGVVAGDMHGFVGHFECRATAREDRGAAQAGLPGEADEAVGRPGSEAVGDVLLIAGQDVDAVVAGLAEGFEVVRAVVEAPENKRRVERDGREGIDGQADRMTVRVDGSDHADAGGESSQGIAQGAAIVLRQGHRD